MTTKKKRPGGRPTKYNKKFCQMLIDHMSEGFSYESFAAVIKVDRSNMYEWEKKYPEYRDAKKKAFDECLLYWEKMGMAGTVGKIKNFAPAMWIFQMKNRFKWSDKQPETIDEDANEIKISYDPNE